MFHKAKRDTSVCEGCIFPECTVLVPCPVDFREIDCVGCGACHLACPHGAITMVEAELESEITIELDGKKVAVPDGITVKRALIELGINLGKFPCGLFVPCETGGCYSCVCEIDGKVKPSCVTKVEEGARIRTELPEDYVPRRIVGGFMGHPVGGVGTPWNLKARGIIEVALFAAGCNFRCPQCQNWAIACRGKESFDYQVLTPHQAAQQITRSRKKYGVNRMAISGGESTLNPGWLVGYLRAAKAMNPDTGARFHVDTNGSLLTPDYIDQLVDVGMSDVGIDLKAWNLDTFVKICGLADDTLAEEYRDTAWRAVGYIREKYGDRVFLGVGIPYNPQLISLEEITLMGRKICEIDPEIQVCALDYRPEFKRMDLCQPVFSEMEEVHEALKATGLTTVLCQTLYGHIGP